ncbi:MAG: protease [Candidatus Poribacteria bacterium]|nr:protease [Candidatus Poribacteria bacterium]
MGVIFLAIDGKKIAILLADDYEDIEFWYPYYRMKEANADVTVVGCVISSDTLRGKRGYMVQVQTRTDKAEPDSFDAILIPGGWAADRLSWCISTLDFIRKAFDQNKVISAISQGVWVLSAAGILKEKNVTSAPNIRDNIKIGGANWTDAEVVVDGNLITSRSTADLPSFCREIIKALSNG